MKDMFRSLKIFSGQTMKSYGLVILGVIVGYAVFALIATIDLPPESFADGFISGFAPSVCMFIPIVGAFMLNAIYSYNMQITQGRKYLRSVPDSARHYRNAVAAVNIVALIILFSAVTVNVVVNIFAETTASPTISAAMGLLCLGLINLVGNSKLKSLRFFVIMPAFLLCGFMVGFTAGASEDAQTDSEAVQLLQTIDLTAKIALAAAIAVYVAGLIVSLSICEKKWRTDDERA